MVDLESNETPKGYIVSHLNVRSVKNKMNELLIILNTLVPHILTLSETWLTSATEDTLLAIEGYSLYRLDRTQPENNPPIKGGGLMTYIRLPAIINSEKYSHIQYSNPDIELQILLVKRGMNKSTMVLNLYRPPSGCLQNFQDHLLTALRTVTQERYADIYLLGDLNLDHTPDAKSEFTKNLSIINIISINTFGLHQIISKPTRVTLTTATLIDVIYVRTKQNTCPIIRKVALSDHYLVACVKRLDYKDDPLTSFYG